MGDDKFSSRKAPSLKLTRLLPVLLLPAVSLLVLGGCALLPIPGNNNSNDDDKDTSDVKETEAPEDDDADAPVDGELAEPGTRAGLNQWLTHSFESTDDVQALIAARLVSVEPVTSTQRAFLDGAFDEGELDGYDVWILKVEEKKVSGGTVEFNADYTSFNPVDDQGRQIQGLTVIGWDDCKSLSFDEEFDTNGGVLTQCILAATLPGDDAPAGVNYTGGYEDENPYSNYDGKPLLFINE